jgi:hypothetical protein
VVVDGSRVSYLTILRRATRGRRMFEPVRPWRGRSTLPNFLGRCTDPTFAAAARPAGGSRAAAPGQATLGRRSVGLGHAIIAAW